jgi:DMSO reductase anchor subunit
MHPAPSVIVFTVCSGLGFGLLFFLGLGMPAVTGWTAFAFYTIAYVLSVGGLLSSMFHLGRPERFLKAFSQWKTSWLSREGVLSVAALTIMGLYAAGQVFFGTRLGLLGFVGSLLSLATVFGTSMIYGQLKTVPRWNHATTPAMFVSLSLAGGALLAGQIRFALPLLILAAIIQVAHWMMGDQQFKASGTTLKTATQLQGGDIRAFEPPHTGSNYLLREMVHQVGRKNAAQLRILTLVLAFGVPALLLILPFSHMLAGLAVISHLMGVFASRWLFFAQAEHVVGLYYGQR